MADRMGWLEAVEAELRAVGRELEVPPAGDVTGTVRRRLSGRAVGRRHALRLGTGIPRWRPGWRAALVTVAALMALGIATPQGRAAIGHAFRFAGVELHLEPGPAHPPRSTSTLPGQRPMTLEEARRLASFPVLGPALLGPPSAVVVSDGGRVVSLIYHRAPYGLVRIDEYAGHLDQIFFEKFIHMGDVTEVTVNGAKALWIKGPHDLFYVTRDGTPVIASARLTTGNTLIWGTGQVALRLEGDLGQAGALAIAASMR